jgi:hypothetical protein
MDIQTSPSKKIFSTCEDAYITEYKNFIIIILLTLLILGFLGINICGFIADVLNFCFEPIYQIVRNILYMFGFSIGGAINNVADVVSDGAITGIEIADGTIHDATGLMMKATDKDSDEEIVRRRLKEKEAREKKCEKFSLYSQTFDDLLNTSSANDNHPLPVTTSIPISETNFPNDEWCSVDMKDSIQSSRNCQSFVKYRTPK